MKKLSIYFWIVLISTSTKAQSFSDGWKEGYKEGYCNYNLMHRTIKPIFIVPIAPIASIGFNTYEDGYKLGFVNGETDFLKQCSTCDDYIISVPALIEDAENFDDGWKAGYEAGYCEYNLLNHQTKPIFITPIVPIAPAGYTTYKEGYKMGFNDGKAEFLKQYNNGSNKYISGSSIPPLAGASFDDGWKAGYEEGYCEYNLINHRMKPLFITPITPIAPIGYDTYRDGYQLGLQKGREDFKARD